MTQLPAIYVQAVEAEALAFAKKLVVLFREWPRFAPHSIFSPEAFRVAAQQYFKQVARVHPSYMLSIIEQAEAGYKDAREALKDLANEYLHRNELMPPPLATFQMKLNAGSLRARTRTRDKLTNSWRNMVIAQMVLALCTKFGLKPTRRSRRRFSACSILAIALASELPPGLIKPHEKQVETIWNQWKRFVLPSS
jgi:hypothetical protein